MVLTAQICFPSFLSPLYLAPFPPIHDSSLWLLDQLVQGFFLAPLVKKKLPSLMAEMVLFSFTCSEGLFKKMLVSPCPFCSAGIGVEAALVEELMLPSSTCKEKRSVTLSSGEF